MGAEVSAMVELLTSLSSTFLLSLGSLGLLLGALVLMFAGFDPVLWGSRRDPQRAWRKQESLDGGFGGGRRRGAYPVPRLRSLEIRTKVREGYEELERQRDVAVREAAAGIPRRGLRRGPAARGLPGSSAAIARDPCEGAGGV